LAGDDIDFGGALVFDFSFAAKVQAAAGPHHNKPSKTALGLRWWTF